MATYKVTSTTINTPASGLLLKLSFGEQAQNDRIVRDAVAALENLKLEGGQLVLLNGPASLPVAIAIGHAVAHKFSAVGCFDPKMGGYVISVTHNPSFELGQVIASSEVKEG